MLGDHDLADDAFSLPSSTERAEGEEWKIEKGIG